MGQSKPEAPGSRVSPGATGVRAGEEEAAWPGLHAPRGRPAGDSRLPRPRLRAGLPRAPGMLGVGAAPATGSTPGRVRCRVMLRNSPGSRLHPVRPGSRNASALMSGANSARERRTFPAGGGLRRASLALPRFCFFSHTLGLLLYLSLIIRPALRNPRLPQRQLLLIYPPVTEKRWLAARPARGGGRWARPRLR